MRESVLRDTCETAMLSALHPRTAVTVILQEMQDSGGVSYLYIYFQIQLVFSTEITICIYGTIQWATVFVKINRLSKINTNERRMSSGLPVSAHHFKTVKILFKVSKFTSFLGLSLHNNNKMFNYMFCSSWLVPSMPPALL